MHNFSSIFRECARTNPEIWRRLRGQRVCHRKFGEGTILKVTLRNNVGFSSSVHIKFDQKVKSPVHGMTHIIELALTVFDGKTITRFSISPELAQELRELKQQEENESKASDEFEERKKRYFVSSYKDNSPISPLNRILIELEGKNYLNKEDEAWLRSRKLYPVLAIYFERLNRLASAGSNWRKANNPDRALEITESITQPDHFILTMRGGAYRDKLMLEKAEECGLKAVKMAPSDYQPYNLLGAVNYQRGSPEEGEKYFKQARELGSKPFEEDGSIKSALTKAGENERIHVVEYLIKKDPHRYNWAKYYLNKEGISIPGGDNLHYDE